MDEEGNKVRRREEKKSKGEEKKVGLGAKCTITAVLTGPWNVQ